MKNRVEVAKSAKSFATESMAVKKAAEFCQNVDENLRYLIVPVEVDGKYRFAPVFLGQSAVQAGAMFAGYMIAG